MKIDASLSEYQEVDDLSEFSRIEKKHCRILLRRLRFLEAQVREHGGLGSASGSGAAAFNEWEVMALEWALTDIGFIKTVVDTPQERNRA